jgi:AcrR family transcriptional regulator
VATDGECPGRPLRRDALANQERLLAAATAVFLREGHHVPMATIAAEAGVGVGTLYRRYPSRDALLEALTLRSFRLLVALAEEAEEAEGRQGDALARLDRYWDRVIDERDQLVLPLHGGPPVTADDVRAERARLHACLRRLLDAGRRDGSIRADVDTSDIVLFGAMLVAPLPGASDWDAVARRQKAIHLDGLRSSATTLSEHSVAGTCICATGCVSMSTESEPVQR